MQNIQTFFAWIFFSMGLLRWLSGKESASHEGDTGLIPGSGRSPREKMADHSSILTWEIPWTEETGGLESMGLQRVGHNLLAIQQQHACIMHYKVYIIQVFSLYEANSS